MFRSLHMKLVLIMLLLITSLMTVVGTFMMTNITGFFIDEFYQQVDSVFGGSYPANAAFVNSLRLESSQPDGLQTIQGMIEAKAGDLGLNSSTRNYYILDGRTGAFLTGSDDQKGFESLQTTQNLLTARNSIADGTDTVGDQSDITANYMDAAIPISGGENAYIIYIYDNRSTVNDLNGKLFLIILQALLVGLLISVLLSFLLSKTMIIPIERLTERAEQVAAGDFGSTIAVESSDEIGILTTTFNDMAAVLEDTLEEVASERNKLDTLFLHMTDGVISFSGDGSILTCNPSASRMLGREVSFYDYDALFGQELPLQKVMSLQRPNFASRELTVGERILELYLAPVSEGEDGGVMAVMHDVTAQRKNEEMRKEFVANVSHELRTPLTNIRSYAETLTGNAGELPLEMEQKFLGVILNESDRMTHIVQDLLTLSRFDSGRSELKLAPFPFGDAVQDVYNAILMEAQRHGHTVELQRAEAIPEILGDRERVLQVMMNVVSNAIKYTPDGGRIRISAGKRGPWVWMEVEDNGIGIPQEDRGRIFERFYRVDKARSRESGGTGLGLSIAKEIVDRHEGALELVDRPGPGLTVRLALKVEGPRHGRS